MSGMLYYVFRPIINGEKRWGYWYRDGNRKRQVIKHPQTGRRFATKREVDEWISQLRTDWASGSSATFEELCEHLFDASGTWAERRRRQRDGQSLSEATLVQHRQFVRDYILPYWKSKRIIDTTSRDLDTWLYDLELSNAMRRGVAITMNVVLKEAQRRGIMEILPAISLPAKAKKGRRSVLSLDGLSSLFPSSAGELRRVWSFAGSQREEEYTWLMFAACAATMFYGGLRPQEARAIHHDQIIPELAAVLVTRSMDSQNKILEYTKGGDAARDPRYRFTLLPDRAQALIDEWIGVSKPAGPVFTFHQKILRREHFNKRVVRAIGMAKVKTEGRKFSAYSGRYTYVTVVKPFLDRAALMTLTGHIDEAMPERYDKPYLLERARQMQSVRANLNGALEIAKPHSEV